MHTSLKKSLSPRDIKLLQNTTGEDFSSDEKLTIELPDYSKIKGVSMASVKSSAQRRHAYKTASHGNRLPNKSLNPT